MTIRIPAAILATTLLASALPAPAQTPVGVTAAVTAGTLGVGPEIGWRPSTRFGVRGNATFLGVSHSFGTDDVEYDGRARLRSAGAMLDWFSMAGGFRLSAGARYNRNRARAVATPMTSTTIGNMVYTPAQIGTISGSGTVHRFAPAATIGWAGQRAHGFVLGVEAGALFQGRVRVSRFVNNGVFANNASFLADLARERQDLQDDVDKYKVYPILQLTAGWRF